MNQPKQPQTMTIPITIEGKKPFMCKSIRSVYNEVGPSAITKEPCGNTYFDMALQLYVAGPIESGLPKPALAAQPIYVCRKCGTGYTEEQILAEKPEKPH
jgi:hypothetical protein